MTIFSGISALRTILDTETDANSPLSEELMSQIRENIEALLMILLGTNASGTLTSDPPNDTTGWAIDTAAGFTDDQHNGRTLLFTSGDAKGNMYTIDDTEAGNNRVECAGDNLYSDGVRSGDAYVILYDLLVNTDGHDHDGVNSKYAAKARFGRTLASIDSEDRSTNNESYETVFEHFFYIPSNPTTFTARFELTGGGVGNDGYVNVIITDSGSSTASEEETKTGSTYETKTVDIDCSGLASGWGKLEIQMKTEATAYAAAMKKFCGYWNQ